MDGPRNPSTIFFQYERIRRSIIASYWIVIILAIPLWWQTTSIERLSLPSSEVYAQAEAHRGFQLPVRIILDSEFTKRDNSLALEVQTVLKDSSALDIRVSGSSGRSEGDSYLVLPSESQEIRVEGRELFFPLEKASASVLAKTLASFILPDKDHRVVQYSPRYRLSFSLLNEDSSGGQVVEAWDASNGIARHIEPITSALSVLHNFTIESQAQFYAPLAFEPLKLSEDEAYGLTPEQLTVFVNSAEWTLSSSSSNDPVLHFLLFVPSASRRPLKILNKEGKPTNSNSFLIPQWGGIVIANLPESPSKIRLSTDDLKSSFTTFSQQLLTLLGVPRLSSGAVRSRQQPTGWQIDALLRYRAIENVVRTSDTLRSTVSLVEQIPNMPVGEKVRNDVRDALKALKSLSSSSNMTLTGILATSRDALTLSQKAFFHPGMLALLYFPVEHKYAVYTPLFASAIIPLVVAAMREVVAWRKQRRGVQVPQG
ncbi:hypothetical protein E1B28_005732 [Marasmius oreades]|uniref:GPI transamidase component PIG-S n=1 Tax=Marasmius oreades TaxID=181124 RepID=A0A9P7S584_9AGAR|nr:uncharacterized protein E1B28_005732 [Marasmius oreades]KAG7094926.1 hypothetical protein E1B28_005732 [Marasmius oreades]